jgi:hypothetical protein
MQRYKHPSGRAARTESRAAGQGNRGGGGEREGASFMVVLLHRS